MCLCVWYNRHWHFMLRHHHNRHLWHGFFSCMRRPGHIRADVFNSEMPYKLTTNINAFIVIYLSILLRHVLFFNNKFLPSIVFIVHTAARQKSSHSGWRAFSREKEQHTSQPGSSTSFASIYSLICSAKLCRFFCQSFINSYLPSARVSFVDAFL